MPHHDNPDCHYCGKPTNLGRVPAGVTLVYHGACRVQHLRARWSAEPEKREIIEAEVKMITDHQLRADSPS